MRTLAILLVAAPLAAQDVFESKIRPILANQCQVCHNPKLLTGAIDLSTPEGFAKVDHGRLIAAIGYQGKIKMPPTGKLEDAQIADLAAWVKAGAQWPKTKAGGQRRLWSLEPVRNPAPPAIRGTAWVANPVDNFILAKLEAKGLVPAPPAGELELLRRAAFDLTGLPPTEGEIRDFLADASPQAFARVVDRLLASPRYGERWGRHWLDVARYADSTGADEDHRYPHAWRYRDYVIDAFNRDLPYDRFVMEQIAGDLLPPDQPGEVNARGIVATGLLALGPRLIAEQDKPKMVYDFIDEQIDVVGRGILGLTIACARCHDHKFDPITTKDYYSLAAIFASTKAFKKVEGTVSQMYFAPLVPADVHARHEEHQNKVADKKKEMDEVSDAEAAAHAARLRPRLRDYMIAARAGRPAEGLDPAVLEKWIRYLKPEGDVRPHLDRWQQASDANLAEVASEYQERYEQATADWDRTLARWRMQVESAMRNQMPPPDKPRAADTGKDRFFAEVSSGKGPFALPEKEDERLALFSAASRERFVALGRQWEGLKKTSPPEPPMACAVAEGKPVEQRVFLRGNVSSPGDAVAKQFPVVLAGENQAPITGGSGRLELARWLGRPDHPLTARVMVNRIWQWHFGEGLMRTPSNWGALGELPTHPELLDYLARRFVESGWSIKTMHRTLMLSSAYRMSSRITAEQAKADPANRLWSRFPRRRLAVEEIRDAMLALDGSLDLTVGGTLQTGTGTDGENASGRLSFSPEKSHRRTVYLPLRRSNLPALLNLFDFGDATTTTEARARTNVAPQALFMMNSKFVVERVEALAKTRPDVERAYLAVLGRSPSAEETAEARDYVATAGWGSFYRILLASNEFIYVD